MTILRRRKIIRNSVRLLKFDDLTLFLKISGKHIKQWLINGNSLVYFEWNHMRFGIGVIDRFGMSPQICKKHHFKV